MGSSHGILKSEAKMNMNFFKSTVEEGTYNTGGKGSTKDSVHFL